MIQRNDKDTAKQSTPKVNNGKPTKKNPTLHKKVLFKDAVLITHHSSFQILSHLIAPWTALIVRVDKVLVTVPSKDAVLPYPLLKIITTQFWWVRRSLRWWN